MKKTIQIVLGICCIVSLLSCNEQRGDNSLELEDIAHLKGESAIVARVADSAYVLSVKKNMLNSDAGLQIAIRKISGNSLQKIFSAEIEGVAIGSMFFDKFGWLAASMSPRGIHCSGAEFSSKTVEQSTLKDVNSTLNGIRCFRLNQRWFLRVGKQLFYSNPSSAKQRSWTLFASDVSDATADEKNIYIFYEHKNYSLIAIYDSQLNIRRTKTLPVMPNCRISAYSGYCMVVQKKVEGNTLAVAVNSSGEVVLAENFAKISDKEIHASVFDGNFLYILGKKASELGIWRIDVGLGKSSQISLCRFGKNPNFSNTAAVPNLFDNRFEQTFSSVDIKGVRYAAWTDNSDATIAVLSEKTFYSELGNFILYYWGRIFTGIALFAVVLFWGKEKRTLRNVLSLLGTSEIWYIGKDGRTEQKTITPNRANKSENNNINSELLQKIRNSVMHGSAISDIIEVSVEGEPRSYLAETITDFNIFGKKRGVYVRVQEVTDAAERKKMMDWAQLAHDMQTNLAVIKLTSEKLSQQNEHKDKLELILHQVNILLSRVRDVLYIGKQGKKHFFLHSNQEIADEAVKEITGLVHEATIVKKNIDYCDFLCDKDSLQRALRNMISNSVKALGNSGGVIFLRSYSRNNFVVFEIEDSGVGMDEATREKMFKPFFTTASGMGGTGIGSVVIQDAAQLHNGTVSVNSELGKGTRVTLYIPLQPYSGTTK